MTESVMKEKKDQEEKTKRRSGSRLLRSLWGTFPWLIVIGIVLFLFHMIGEIKQEKARLEDERKAAMKKETPPVKVITLTVRSGVLKDKISLPAEVEPSEEVLVKAQVSGEVVQVLAKEGKEVKRGQVILLLDSSDYKSRLERIEANYRLARLEYQRNVTLAKSNATSKAKLDSTEAQVKDLEAQLQVARLALEHTRVRSPLSCILNNLIVERGDYVSVGDPVAQILGLDPVKVTVGIPESDVATIFDLKQADVIINALGNLRVKGKKVFLARKPRTLARLYDLELAVPNPRKRILPGMFAQVELVKSVFPKALTIPLYTVISHGEEQYVFIERDGHAEKRQVKLGILAEWQVQVLSGLTPGDKVVVVGHRQLEEGQRLEVIKNVNDPSEILKS
jgi:membrane fusion protein, multidrug efflux system